MNQETGEKQEMKEPRRTQTPAPPFSVILPCYNEQGAIRDIVEELGRTLAESGAEYEIIAIDDGSTDGTGAILAALETRGLLRLIRHDRNRGYGAALKTGLVAAAHELIAITDADGTYPNERLTELVAEAANVDMVVGARIAKDAQMSRLRAVPKVFLTRWASWLAGQTIPDINSGMRVFRKSIAERFIGILPDTFSFTTTITLAMLTNYYRVKYVPISYKARIGRSKISPFADTLRFTLLILRTGTYFAPLRVLGPVIAVLAVLSFTSLAYDYFVLRNFTDKTVLLFLFTMNTGMFALLADMIDKRTRR